MKKTYYLYGIILLALILAVPVISRAENGDGSSNTAASANADVSVTASSSKPRLGPESIREKLQAEYEARQKNIKENQAARNALLEERRGIATTSRAEIKDIRMDGRDDMRNASSSTERKEIRHDMRWDIFKVRLDRLIKELMLSLNNLRQIRSRIDSRITKAEQNGKDMTDAKALLVTADAKITLADQAIDALAALNVTATSTTANGSTTIDLMRPRKLGADAIKSIKDARDALRDVVRAIAHDLGLNLDEHDEHGDIHATSTASTTTQ